MDHDQKMIYTRRQAGKELAAIEQHLRGFDENQPQFCMECIGKHALHLSAVSDEGKTFFPDDLSFWQRLGAWADRLLDEGEAGRVASHAVAATLAAESRDLRKELQELYMGEMGKCKCITGNEPCCVHGKAAGGRDTVN